MKHFSKPHLLNTELKAVLPSALFVHSNLIGKKLSVRMIHLYNVDLSFKMLADTSADPLSEH